MHGSISVESPTFLMSLRSRVIILPSWRRALGARANQLAGVGHIVVRVAKGGASYRVVVADESTESLTVKGLKGPYESQ